MQIDKSYQELEDLVDALASGEIAQAVKEINNFRFFMCPCFMLFSLLLENIGPTLFPLTQSKESCL